MGVKESRCEVVVVMACAAVAREGVRGRKPAEISTASLKIAKLKL